MPPSPRMLRSSNRSAMVCPIFGSSGADAIVRQLREIAERLIGVPRPYPLHRAHAREIHVERAALALAALHIHRAADLAHDPVTGRETEAGAARCRARREERLEDVWEIGFGDADAR